MTRRGIIDSGQAEFEVGLRLVSLTTDGMVAIGPSGDGAESERLDMPGLTIYPTTWSVTGSPISYQEGLGIFQRGQAG